MRDEECKKEATARPKRLWKSSPCVRNGVLRTSGTSHDHQRRKSWTQKRMTSMPTREPLCLNTFRNCTRPHCTCQHSVRTVVQHRTAGNVLRGCCCAHDTSSPVFAGKKESEPQFIKHIDVVEAVTFTLRRYSETWVPCIRSHASVLSDAWTSCMPVVFYAVVWFMIYG